jgi:hypothetical protein
MHVLVVYAHPSPDSFTHALLEQVTRGLDDGPHSYQVNARAPAERLPADVRAQQALVAKADGLIFIAPVFWMALPAILKGWFERVFAYGFAYTLTQEGWQGDLEGRVPLLLQEKAADPHPDVLHQGGVRQGLAGRDGHGHLRLGSEDGGSQGGPPRLLLRGGGGG